MRTRPLIVASMPLCSLFGASAALRMRKRAETIATSRFPMRPSRKRSRQPSRNPLTLRSQPAE